MQDRSLWDQTLNQEREGHVMFPAEVRRDHPLWQINYCFYPKASIVKCKNKLKKIRRSLGCFSLFSLAVFRVVLPLPASKTSDPVSVPSSR